ncbi:unnamed protein product [Arctia plantaginis]|uniref:EGF-like domain-containing protein n=1 Tax=Arctia plantaginis TaxID=874455 RepID=A0A8S0ZLI2_ARCPL|nr:unnamed protein product [Arctia plantaginis]
MDKGRRRNWRRRREADTGETSEGCACQNGGHCVWTDRGRACVCAGAWGGPTCALYVGHDHACAARACPPPAICVWGPDTSGTKVYCACLEGASCTSPRALPQPGVVAGGTSAAADAGGAWAGAGLALLALLVAVLAALYVLHRRRHGAFVHARLADNVEINNPMYLAGEDELEPHAEHSHTNGGNHFANPVYESMYAAQQNNPGGSIAEEHANLLAGAARAGSPPPERAALL